MTRVLSQYICNCRCSSVSYLKRASTFLAWDLVDPLHLVASYWVSPACLLALRFCMLLHLAAAIVVDGVLGRTSQHLEILLFISCSGMFGHNHFVCIFGTDKTIHSQWPLDFCNWSSIMTGWTGVVGCLVSTKHLTSHALQSSSPRTTLGATNHLKRHQSDVCCDLNTLDMPASLNTVVPTNMVRRKYRLLLLPHSAGLTDATILCFGCSCRLAIGEFWRDCFC